MTLARLGIGIVTVAAIGSALVAITGASPLAAVVGLVEGAVGERYTLSETVVSAIPLALVALGVVPALRAGIFSIGSEGQLATGALAATAAIQLLPADAAQLSLLLAGALGGLFGGVAWAALPALLRAYGRVNEILSTLLLNYVAGFLLLWSLRTWLATPEIVPIPQSAPLPDAALIPKLVEGTRLHWGLAAVPALAIGLAWWLRSPSGLRYRIIATHPLLAARLGLASQRAVIATMLFSGAAAGLAGWLQVAGVAGTLYPGVANGLGFTGILVALLGGLRPASILIAAFFLAALRTGSDGLQAGTGIPSSIAFVVQGLVLLVAALAFASPLLGYRSRPSAEAAAERAVS
ncbi:Inner-membrane translocator [Mesorhizobium plurifarium]|uniref:Inner-membrane translocator n=1 Tax=Mesorhizobium plurifarium TaxID=69974 RepID=A0A0K2VQG7_MESPL|nr:Inner-membrane translocator [Mesorhizobium plurifarium]